MSINILNLKTLTLKKSTLLLKSKQDSFNANFSGADDIIKKNNFEQPGIIRENDSSHFKADSPFDDNNHILKIDGMKPATIIKGKDQSAGDSNSKDKGYMEESVNYMTDVVTNYHTNVTPTQHLDSNMNFEPKGDLESIRKNKFLKDNNMQPNSNSINFGSSTTNLNPATNNINQINNVNPGLSAGAVGIIGIPTTNPAAMTNSLLPNGMSNPTLQVIQPTPGQLAQSVAQPGTFIPGKLIQPGQLTQSTQPMPGLVGQPVQSIAQPYQSISSNLPNISLPVNQVGLPPMPPVNIMKPIPLNIQGGAPLPQVNSADPSARGLDPMSPLNPQSPNPQSQTPNLDEDFSVALHYKGQKLKKTLNTLPNLDSIDLKIKNINSLEQDQLEKLMGDLHSHVSHLEKEHDTLGQSNDKLHKSIDVVMDSLKVEIEDMQKDLTKMRVNVSEKERIIINKEIEEEFAKSLEGYNINKAKYAHLKEIDPKEFYDISNMIKTELSHNDFYLNGENF